VIRAALAAFVAASWLVCGDDTLPSAKCIFGAGLAYSDPQLDETRDTQFRAVLDYLSPDASRPVAFFFDQRQ